MYTKLAEAYSLSFHVFYIIHISFISFIRYHPIQFIHSLHSIIQISFISYSLVYYYSCNCFTLSSSVCPHSLFDMSDEPEERRMWNIVYGVREDCVTLLQHFELKGSLRFQDFAACWRDMMFSHMLRLVGYIFPAISYAFQFIFGRRR